MVLPASVCADFCVEEADASSSKPYLSWSFCSNFDPKEADSTLLRWCFLQQLYLWHDWDLLVGIVR
jgi:hypothetical protein